MASKNTTKYLSNKQEKQVAKDIGGKTVIASGSLWGMKSDARSDKYLIECKTTQKESYRLTASTWEKVTHEAINDGLRVPVMCIEVAGVKKAVFSYYMLMDSALFKDLTDPLDFKECKHLKSFLVDKNNQIVKITTKINPQSSTTKTSSLCVIDWEDFLEVIGE